MTRLKIDFAVFRVGSKPFHQNDFTRIIYLHHQAVLVTPEIKDDDISSQKTGAGISALYLVRPVPISLLNLGVPSLDLFPDICMLAARFDEQFPVQDVHLFPIWEQNPPSRPGLQGNNLSRVAAFIP